MHDLRGSQSCSSLLALRALVHVGRLEICTPPPSLLAPYLGRYLYRAEAPFPEDWSPMLFGKICLFAT